MTHTHRKNAHWNKIKQIIDDKSFLSTASSLTKDPEVVSVVNDLQRQVLLYGEEYLLSLPGYRHRKQQIDGLLELTGKLQKVLSGNDVIHSARKRKILKKFYKRIAKTLVYEECSRKTSLSTTRVRQRLCDLMGTDVIRLNDKRYFQKLSERLQDEYETIMDKQEEARAASEEQRIRRLMLEGVIDAPNDYRAVVHGTHHKPQTKKKLKSGKRHSSARSHREATGSAGSDEEGQTKTKKEEVETQVGLMSGSRPGSHKSSLRMRASNENARTPSRRVFIDEKENDRAQQQQQQQTSNEMHARPPHHENVLRSPSACGTHRKERRVQSAAPRLTRRENGRTSPGESESDGEGGDGIGLGDRPFDTQSLPDRNAHRMYSKYSVYEPERVSRLRGAETVEGLYAIAEEIVSPVRAGDDTDRKVVRVPKQKKMTTSLS